MLIAHISDCHVVAPDQRVFNRVDTLSALQAAVTAIHSLPRQPDLVIATGDLADSGASEEYALFREVLQSLPVPVLPVMGNHDNRKAMATSFDGEPWLNTGSEFIEFAYNDGPVRILVGDSVTAGSDEPNLDDNRLSWLRTRLSESSRPTIIALHHPPFATGIAWMEAKELRWADDLKKLVIGYPNIVRILCGHIHRPMTALWGGTCVMSAPSTAHQVVPDFNDHSPARFSLESPGFLLHHWNGSTMISSGVAIRGLADTFEV